MATVTIQKRTRRKGIRYLIYYKEPSSGRKKYYKTSIRLKDAQQVANDLRVCRRECENVPKMGMKSVPPSAE
jgi:hypothetical protein